MHGFYIIYVNSTSSLGIKKINKKDMAANKLDLAAVFNPNRIKPQLTEIYWFISKTLRYQQI